MTIENDGLLYAIAPHAHYSGRSMKTYLITPDKKKKLIHNLFKYDFNWQGYYFFKEPIRAPKGSQLYFEFIFDNSPNNKYLSKPLKPLKFGGETTDEMLWVGIYYRALEQRKSNKPVFLTKNRRRLFENVDNDMSISLSFEEF